MSKSVDSSGGGVAAEGGGCVAKAARRGRKPFEKNYEKLEFCRPRTIRIRSHSQGGSHQKDPYIRFCAVCAHSRAATLCIYYLSNTCLSVYNVCLDGNASEMYRKSMQLTS